MLSFSFMRGPVPAVRAAGSQPRYFCPCLQQEHLKQGSHMRRKSSGRTCARFAYSRDWTRLKKTSSSPTHLSHDETCSISRTMSSARNLFGYCYNCAWRPPRFHSMAQATKNPVTW